MASLISTSTFLSTPSTTTKSALYPLSSSLTWYSKAPKFGLPWNSQLGYGPLSQWSGLKHLGISILPKSLAKGGASFRFARKGKCKGRVVYASLFGVGAPEALVIGVVALLVFGPKGLAEVARNLGKTLRAFQPTIRELQEVSREFKSTLEREIGLDDIPTQTQNTYSPNRTNTDSTSSSITSTENSSTVAAANGTPSASRAYTSEEYLKITEEQLKATAVQQQGQTTPSGESQFNPQTHPHGTVKDTASSMPPPQKGENEV